MVCLGSVRAGGNQGEGESEEVKWGSLMMTRLDIARQTVSSCLPCELCLTHTCGSYTLHSHKRSRVPMHTHMWWAACTRPPPSSLFRNYLLFKVLRYKSNWSLWPPANPWGCAGNPSSNVYTQEAAQPPEQQSLTLPSTPTTHNRHTHTDLPLCSSALGLALPAGEKGVVPRVEVCSQINFVQSWNRVLIASRKQFIVKTRQIVLGVEEFIFSNFKSRLHKYLCVSFRNLDITFHFICSSQNHTKRL